MEYHMGYSKFIEIGVERQKESVTVDEATRQYVRSCECCARKGFNFNYDCDFDCPVTVAHREKLEAIRFLRQMEHQKQENILKKLDECIKLMESIYAEIYTPSQLDEKNEQLDKLSDEWAELSNKLSKLRTN